MSDRRPILLGMNNPLSANPAHALVPFPAGCAGWRVWQMLREASGREMLRKEYMDAFDRRNLVAGMKWSRTAGRVAAERFHREATGRVMVVLGAQTWRALGLPETDWLGELRECLGTTWWRFPHPSGRNLLLNDARFRRRAGRLLLDIGGLQ